jgi:hypothetical protein
MICLERKLAFSMFVLLFLGLGFSAVSVLPVNSIDWPLFHRNLEHKGTTPELVLPPLTLLWNYTTGSDVYSSPAVSDGVVYVGSFDNRVYGLNASTGVQIWNYTVGGLVECVDGSADLELYRRWVCRIVSCCV